MPKKAPAALADALDKVNLTPQEQRPMVSPPIPVENVQGTKDPSRFDDQEDLDNSDEREDEGTVTLPGQSLPGTVLHPVPPEPPLLPEDGKKTEDGKKQKQPRFARSGELYKFIQSAERVRIYRRARDHFGGIGRLEYVNDYSARDLRETGSIDVFIHKYIVPRFGYGEYYVELVKADGTAYNAGSVSVAAPLTEDVPKSGTDAGRLETLFDKFAALARERDKVVEETIEKRRKEYMEMLGTANAQGRSPDMMTVMMLNESMRRATPAADSTSVLVEAMREAIRETKESRTRASRHFDDLPPISSLPMLPESPSGGMSEMAKAFAEVAKSLRGDSLTAKDMIALVEARTPKPTDWKDIAATVASLTPTIRQLLGLDMLQRQLDDQSRRQEELMRDIRDGSRTGITDVMRQAHELRSFMHEFGGGRDVDNFWSTVNATLDRVPKIIESIKGYKERQQLTARSETAADTTTKPKETNLELPDTLLPMLQNLESVTDEAELIGGYLSVLKELMKIDEWRKAMEVGMKAIYVGNKAVAMQFITSVLEGLRDGKHISVELYERSVRVFDSNFEQLSNAMSGKQLSA